MTSRTLFQLRITVSAELAAALRANAAHDARRALDEIMRAHDASLHCQFDAFAHYVSEAQRLGPENFPLYQWTRETIENPEKKAKYLRSFTVYVNGAEVYEKNLADSLEAELLKLVNSRDVIHVSRFDTDPAHNPQPPARHKSGE